MGDRVLAVFALCAAGVAGLGCAEGSGPAADLAEGEFRVEPLLATPLGKDLSIVFANRAVMRVPQGKALALRVEHDGKPLFTEGIRWRVKEGNFGPARLPDPVRLVDVTGPDEVVTLETAIVANGEGEDRTHRLVVGLWSQGETVGFGVPLVDVVLPMRGASVGWSSNPPLGELAESPALLFEVGMGKGRSDVLRATLALEGAAPPDDRH
jgi:hypothetical protein